MTLKVSTIEQTAEQVDARGGWGNPKLITWDFGKEATITLEDALISPESLAFMMGGAITDSTVSSNQVIIARSAVATLASGSDIVSLFDGASQMTYTSAAGKGNLGVAEALNSDGEATVKYINFTKGTRGSLLVNTSAQTVTGMITVSGLNDAIDAANTASVGTASVGTFAQGDKVRFFWNEKRTGAETNSNPSAVKITISPNTFPGTYKIVGDTFIRKAGGNDSAFQFVIPAAKVSSDVTLTLEAEGDPSTFSMDITVLRKDEQEMISFIKY